MKPNDSGKMTVVYTPGYAPPEQILGKPEPRSDLFSLAATLYHLATGKEPSGTETAAEIQSMLDDPRSPIPPDYRWLFEVLKINLSEDPNDRYYSAQEFKADLERRCVTTEMACPKCQAANRVRMPYCRRCAAPLTAVFECRHCNRTNHKGSRCCIHCGKWLR
jgi:serine/threonine-protein kinase